MKEQIFILEHFDSFILKDIFECGQCFRWKLNPDKSYTGVFGNNVLNVKKEERNLIFHGVCEDKIIPTVIQYFDLETDYLAIKKKLEKVDKHLKTSISYGQGIRILNQDLWETIISFIISANNNIPRIKGIIERLCKQYGDEILMDGKPYYTFPTPEQLAKVTIEEYRTLGLGFRDKRVYETTQKVLRNEIDLENLKNLDTKTVKQELEKLDGVGPKVADCILLFSSLKRREVFPIDVWVRRVMNQLYIKKEDENKVSKKEIIELAQEKFGDLAGMAQQYLFYWKRES